MPIVKRTPAGAIYTREGSTRLYLRFQGRWIATRLQNTKGGVTTAVNLLDEIYWKDQEERRGLSRPTVLTRKPTVQEAFEEVVEERSNNAPRTKRDYWRSLHDIIGGRASEILTDELIAESIRKYPRRVEFAMTTRHLVLRTFHVFTTWSTEQKDYLGKTHKFQHLLGSIAPPEPEIYTIEELRSLYRYFLKRDEEFALFLRFLTMTGFRIGKALALKWSDVRPEYIVRISKRGTERRPFPVTPALRRLLQRLSHDRKKVFRWDIESQSRLGKWLRDAMKDLGIERRGRLFHEFKKTAWNALLAAKIDIGTAADLMDTSYDVARAHYLTFDMERLQNAARSIPKKMGRQGQFRLTGS
jgi:integrase